MTRQVDSLDRLYDMVSPLIARELAAIGALDSAIAQEQRPDYVVLFQSAKTNKQANVEQLSTLIRMSGGVPPERARLRTTIMKTQAVLAEKLSGTTAMLSAMRLTGFELLERYADAHLHNHGLVARALHKALHRTIVDLHIITAHLAKRTGDAKEAARLPLPLDRYFAGADAKACMRCHFDRPGANPALERGDPHPYTYVCAGCHDDAIAEWPADLRSQMPRWPADARAARVIQHALGRGSILHASHTVLHELSGLKPDVKTPAAEKARTVPVVPESPHPAEDTARERSVEPHSEAEAGYVRALFDYRSIRTNW
jgi:hypothetical protein